MKKMKTKHLLIALLCLTITAQLQSQTITLNFPHFAGRTWDLIFLRGLKQDTVLTGLIPEGGRVLLNIPESRRDYVGMGRWMLRNGGGLDFVVNGESFSVECLSDQPNESNIIYSGSVENDFLRDNHQEQEKLVRKIEAVRMALRAYPEGTDLYTHLEKEDEILKNQYEVFHRNLSASPLYAARFREIVNFTRGIGSSLEDDEYTLALKTDQFLRHKMSWPALYTSNHWSGVTFSWVQMHTAVIKQDSALLNSARDILTKFEDPERYTALCEQISRYFNKYGKDSLIQVLAPEIAASGKLLHYDGLLAPFRNLSKGANAPSLVFPDGKRLDWSSRPAKAYLLAFYQTDCGHCEEMLGQMTANYPNLERAGVHVVSISGDVDKATFEEAAAGHPWKDKLFDGKGFDGPNFKAYGVIGTPTLLAIGKSGQILHREARLPEMLLWLEQNALQSGTR
jgi:peroxiredoxin